MLSPWDLYRTMELPLWPVLHSMERAGVGLDMEVMGVLAQEVDQKVQETRAIMAEYGVSNPNSTAQLRKILYGDFGLRPPHRTETGEPSTDADAIALMLTYDLAPLIRRFVTALDDYREVGKLKSTYVDKLPLMRGDDGLIHTNYMQHVVETSRLSSREPNLQNIPARTAMGRRVRQAVRAPQPDQLLVKADFSQLELRIIAALSKDPNLLHAYTADPPVDVHSLTALKQFGSADDTYRRIGKTANFGVVYGASASRFSLLLIKEAGLVKAIPECKEIIDGWWDVYKGVRTWREQEWAQVLARGYTQTYYGHRNPIIIDFGPEEWGLMMALQRQALNFPIQGTGAGVVKLWMIRLHQELKRRGLRSEMLLQVHDELDLGVPPEELDEVAPLIKETGEMLFEGVPLIIEVSVGPNWQDQEKVK